MLTRILRSHVSAACVLRPPGCLPRPVLHGFGGAGGGPGGYSDHQVGQRVLREAAAGVEGEGEEGHVLLLIHGGRAVERVVYKEATPHSAWLPSAPGRWASEAAPAIVGEDEERGAALLSCMPVA